MTHTLPLNPLERHLERTGTAIPAFAEKLSVSRTHLWRLVKGHRMADTPMLAKINRETDGDVPPNDWVAWYENLEKAKQRCTKRRRA